MMVEDKTDKGEATQEPVVDQAIRSHLGTQLKASYEEILKQPVPDRFKQLLAELEKREKPE